MTSDLRSSRGSGRNIEKKPILSSKARLLHPSQGNPRQSEVLRVEKKKLARPLVGYYGRGRVISLSLRIGCRIGWTLLGKKEVSTLSVADLAVAFPLPLSCSCLSLLVSSQIGKLGI